MTTETTPAPKALDDVKGWFPPLDQLLFTWFLERQDRLEQAGDLLELGAYLGKSAILMGRFKRDGEAFTVCDLFDSPAPDDANVAEMERSYSTLTRTAFEANYLAFHETLPEIVQGPTSVIGDHVKPETCRFAHVDASHLYEHVHGDIAAAESALRPYGIVVCDDYRSAHTPGVAAAVWEAVATSGLRPVCLTPQKLYGTWGDPEPVRAELAEYFSGQEGVWHQAQKIGDLEVLRVKPTGEGDASRRKTAAEQEAELRRLRERVSSYQHQVLRLNDELRSRKRQIRSLRGSASYRVGRAITAPPRAMRRLSGSPDGR